MLSFIDKLNILQGSNLALYTSIALLSTIALYFAYNAISYWVLKERYHGIRFTTKNITYITMLIAVSVSVTIVICLIAPVAVIPPIRIGIEAILVKISGIIFGPIVGVIVGFITELLVMLFVPSYVHIGYVLCVVFFGFIGGAAHSFNRASKGNVYILFGLINLFIIVFAAVIIFLYKEYDKPIEILQWKIKGQYFGFVFSGTILITLIGIWITFWFLILTDKKDTAKEVMFILFLATIAEFVATSIVSSWGDAGLFNASDSSGYNVMLLTRLISAPFKILFNTLILYFTYKAVNPLIKRDY
ncbi:hypothetical protein [Spiroplasma endosymbiont of Crioceris asparagi]|uniref:hypothetical protein n=1 Tax=Spiroplasma endosymbiont of Crioceris asparagi TaxID=3066286 RepID=UPI0030D2939D